MKQLYQNVTELNKNIQHEGCYFIDLLNIYQEIACHELTYEMVNAVYILATRNKYMGKDCYIKNIEGISEVVSGLTGINVIMDKAKSEFNFLIAKMHRVTNGGENVYHFVEVYLDSHNVKRDPWKGGSKTARLGRIASLRPIIGRLI